jgi:hypothetical protein
LCYNNNNNNFLTEEKFMSIEDKMKAAAKNVEGKVQSAAGELTGDEKMKAEGGTSSGNERGS